ncbi:MAG TPA: HAMP domain-containing sensor histidine kinase [Thermoanaerobaculia bacterium]|nr:HAMP domain-containing sensor histidine kinase [Thermoanaerobaculia bacterium]
MIEQNPSPEESLSSREAAVATREEAVSAREQSVAQAAMELDLAMGDLREANEHLVVVNVGSQTLAVEMSQSLQEAATASQAKDDFFALLSHELRTPLTSITGWADLLGRNPDPETIAEAARSIAISASLQAKLVDDLLDVSRIMTGKFAITEAMIDFDTVVDDAVSAMRPAATAKGISLMRIAQQSILVRGDAGRLRQVVGNLLSNAVKFTPAGGLIEVRLLLNGSFAVVEVCDTGEGIPWRFLPDVFDRHAQADARRFGGLGLGLAIVKHIVELHGGSVAAVSQGEGKGSTFTVRLPTLRHE